MCKSRHTSILESFHSLLLGYSTKRTSYQYVLSTQITHGCVKAVYFRNESYLARCQLAVLDHNEHTQRQNAVNKSGDVIYHRKYRKPTKKWDASPVKCNKAYKYVPDLMQMIFQERKTSDHGLKHKRTRPLEHPVNIQGTIAHTLPEKTSEIIKNKRSRLQ